MLNARKQMEHRCDRRLVIDVPVTLYFRSNSSVLAWIRNLSRGGAYIEADTHLFSLPTMLYLDFGDGCGCRREATIVPALVIHRGARGAGVMFTQELSDTIYRYAMEYEPSQSSPPTADHGWRHVDW